MYSGERKVHYNAVSQAFVVENKSMVTGFDENGNLNIEY